MCTRVWSKGRVCKVLRFTEAVCPSRKFSSFYEFLLRVRWALFVFWRILRRDKRAQRTYGSQTGWLCVLPTEQLCWQLAGAGLLCFPEKTSQAKVQAISQQESLFACDQQKLKIYNEKQKQEIYRRW